MVRPRSTRLNCHDSNKNKPPSPLLLKKLSDSIAVPRNPFQAYSFSGYKIIDSVRFTFRKKEMRSSRRVLVFSLPSGLMLAMLATQRSSTAPAEVNLLAAHRPRQTPRSMLGLQSIQSIAITFLDKSGNR